MVTGFDIWGHDAGLRRHWKYRLAAFIIDAIIAFVPTSVILYFLGIENIYEVGIISSTVFYLSTIIPETLADGSIGKKLFNLTVHAETGCSLSGRACIRNLNRLFWFVLPPLDFAIGMAMRGDPRQTALDRVAGTKVVHTDETEKYQNHIHSLSVAVEEPQSAGSEDMCNDCGGKLMLLPDSKLQCEKCGLIQ